MVDKRWVYKSVPDAPGNPAKTDWSWSDPPGYSPSPADAPPTREGGWPSTGSVPTNHEAVAKLAAAINVDFTLAALLFQRGICTYEEARSFFRPSLENLHDPFLMKDMDRAVARLDQALRAGERILVYGDYDVDGTTSVALFYGFLKSWWLLPATHLQYYIPDRYSEGYGVSRQGVDWAHQHGFTLIVCLDCGIKSADKVDYAKTLGIDFIVCDHHRPDSELPDAAAVLDPKRSDCSYPFDGLSGCGVGFKFLQAHCQQQEIPFEELYPFLDLLVVSIAADIVPMVGENRILAYFGLQQLNTSPRPGLKALMQVAGCAHFRDISNVVFGLGPRINAAGRVAHAKAAVQLLVADTLEEAMDFARQINLNNVNRRDLDSGITQEALEMIAGDETLLIAKSTVLFKPDWSKGVIGIVASRCIEKYHRPTIILTESHEKAAGSARSVPGFDVYEAIEECADLLEQFGGHTYAAGLSLKLENVPAFRRKFEEVVTRKILPEQLTPLIEVDLNLNLAQITRKFYNILQRMSPFGPQNMPPTFVSKRVRLQGEARVLKEQHLKICVFQEGSPVMEAIGFGMAHFYPRLNAEEPFQICYQITENDFRGTRSLQLQLRDIKFGEVGG